MSNPCKIKDMKIGLATCNGIVFKTIESFDEKKKDIIKTYVILIILYNFLIIFYCSKSLR